MKTPTHAKSIVQSVNSLVEAATDLVDSVGHAAAGAAVALRQVKGGERLAATPAAIARKSARLKKSIKAHWDSMTPRERADRVRRMLAGRGLKPKKKV